MEAIKKLLKKHKTVVFLDFEGTQFTHEIIAVGAIKCKVDENGFIIEKAEQGFKEYVHAKGVTGKLITEMTSITDSFLEENGVPVEVMLERFKTYVHEDLRNVSFIVFGTNDARMILETNKSIDELIKDVCSPGGATLEGLYVFNENKMDEIIKKASKACVDKAYDLSTK